MNQVNVLNAAGNGEMWKNFIDSRLACLCWGIILLVAFVFLLKYLHPLIEMRIKNKHESKMKKKAFEMEKYWHIIEKVDVASNETLQKEICELNKKIKKLEEEKTSIKANSEFKITILEHDIELYKKIIDGLSVILNPANLKTKK